MPRIPKVVLMLIAVFFFIPFFCLFLPFDFPMDRDWKAPYLAYTSTVYLWAHFFYYIPMLVSDALRPINFMLIPLARPS